MSNSELKRIRQRTGTEAQLALELPTMATEGEIIVLTDVRQMLVNINAQYLKMLAENDIVDNLTTNNNKKVLSAKQGIELMTQINQLRDEIDNISVNNSLVHRGNTPPADLSLIWIDTSS